MTAAIPAVLALLLLIIPAAREPGVGEGGMLWSCMVSEEVPLARRQVSHWHPRSILCVQAVAGAFPLHFQQKHSVGKDPANLHPSHARGDAAKWGGHIKPP